jgi:predicted alpha/beta-hydrolase family hydrolase
MQTLRSKTSRPKFHLILAHGAGAPMDSDWMNDLCSELSRHGIKTYRFEFPYMQERRESGKKRPPNPARVLEECWLEALAQLKLEQFFIGGKSLGSRMASHIASQTEAKGLIAYGFPFYTPGKGLSDRHKAMLENKLPTLICQGERDPFGDFKALKKVKWPRTHKLEILPDGDHSLKPRKASGLTEADNLKIAAELTFNLCKES